MNETDPFGDSFPLGTLPQWATITQVSAFLGAPRNAVRSAVRRAVKKRGAMGQERDPGREQHAGISHQYQS